MINMRAAVPVAVARPTPGPIVNLILWLCLFGDCRLINFTALTRTTESDWDCGAGAQGVVRAHQHACVGVFIWIYGQRVKKRLIL